MIAASWAALIGSLDSGSLKNAYATGAVTAGTDAIVGGAFGYAGAGVDAAYSTGAASGTKPGLVGGFAGYDDSAGGMKHDYWDTTTSGVTQGAGNLADDPGIKGLTTKKLRAQLPKGFSTKIWAQDAKINDGLPYLRNNPPANCNALRTLDHESPKANQETGVTLHTRNIRSEATRHKRQTIFCLLVSAFAGIN